MESVGDPGALRVMGCPCCGERIVTPWMQVPDRSQSEGRGYELRRCSSCSHVWLENRLTPAELSQYYKPEYHLSVGRSGEMAPGRWAPHLRVISKYRAAGDILDIGCSSGGFLEYLKSGPWRLHGIEASPCTAERARATTGAEVFSGDVLDADFPDNSFDVITCMDVLEHLYEPRKVLRNVRKWLKPEGIFYVFVPNIRSWEARMFHSFWYGLDLPRHVHHFTPESLVRLATSTGFRQVHLATPPGCYLEESTWILLDDLARRAGVRRPSWAALAKPGVAGRVVRKALRLSVEALFSMLASRFGAAASVQAAFGKGTGRDWSDDESREG